MAFSLLPSTFDEIKTYLITKINTTYPALGAFIESSFLIIILDVVSWAIALFMDYADNLFSEGRLTSAVRYENARLIAKFYGYIAHRKISATGTVKVGMTSAFNSLPTENITFYKYDSLTINGIKFVVSEDKTFSSNPLDNSYEGLASGTYYIEVSVIQGQLIDTTYTADGTQSESYTINDNSIENTVFDVEVDSVDYTKIDSFFLSEPEDTHYTLENIAEMAGVIATFGDDYKGAKLTAGASVNMKYIRTDALDGQIKATGFEVTFDETYAYTDATPVEFYGITTSQMIGASDKEDIESVKYWGQKAASSLSDKAFNDDELQLALQSYGGILKSKAISEYDINPDDPTTEFMNVVKLLVVPTSGTAIDEVTKQSIREYLRPRMDFTDFIQFIDVEYIDIMFYFDMEVFSNAPQDLASQIDTFLQTTYALGELDFGESIDHITVGYNVKTEFLSYIKRFNIILYVVEEETDVALPTAGTLDRTLKIGSLRESQANIKLCKIIATFKVGLTEHTEIHQDNGSGSFLPVGTGDSDLLDSGTINYITGAIALDIKSGVSEISSLEFRYETYDEDGIEENIDIKYNQIIRYNKSQILTESVTS